MLRRSFLKKLAALVALPIISQARTEKQNEPDGPKHLDEDISIPYDEMGRLEYNGSFGTSTVIVQTNEDIKMGEDVSVGSDGMATKLGDIPFGYAENNASKGEVRVRMYPTGALTYRKTESDNNITIDHVILKATE